MIPVIIDAEAIQLLKSKGRSVVTIDVHKSGGG